MKRVIGYVLRKPSGRKSMQKIYETLFRLSLTGLNYGNGGDFKDSGELYVLKYIKEKLGAEKSITLFDVGGNVGNYSKTLAGIFTDNAVIHAFEPSKITFEIFLKTTAGITNIVPNNFGLSDIATDVILYANNDNSGLSSVYQRNLAHFGIAMDKTEKIQLSTVDLYCQKNNINRIHFLKLDVEGHELNVMKGANLMISNKKVDFIQFEFGGCNIDSRTYFQDFYYLLKDKYVIYRILKDGLQEIQQYDERNEIFITINYLAIKRD
ncbi:MAG: FkbM family methyltransferase [Ferruginibacter sp.]|nr:FkbM family methyltransferase [Ferruginibacter sp.]